MNKIVYGVVLFLLAILTTLGIVYFFNKGTFNYNLDKNNSNLTNSTQPASTADIGSQVSIPSDDAASKKANIIIDENTPKNYNDTELINLEKEINSLDISDQPDIQ